MEVPVFSKQAKEFSHGIYRHFKGGEYKTLYIARHSETLEEMIVYQDTRDASKIWCRPLTMFLESTIVNGNFVPRFTKLNE